MSTTTPDRPLCWLDTDGKTIHPTELDDTWTPVYLDTVQEILRERAEERAHTAAIAEALLRWHHAMPVDLLRCPLCGCTVKWSCGVGEHPRGHADCEGGGAVSRRVHDGPVCPWRGTRVIRIGDHVLVPLPVRLDARAAPDIARDLLDAAKAEWPERARARAAAAEAVMHPAARDYGSPARGEE